MKPETINTRSVVAVEGESVIYDSDKFTKLANESENANELSRALRVAVGEADALRAELDHYRAMKAHFQASCPHVAHDAQTNACLACGVVRLRRREAVK